MIIGDGIRLRGIDRGDLPLFRKLAERSGGTTVYFTVCPSIQCQEEKWFENVEKLSVAEQPLMMEIWHEQKWKAVGNIGFIAVNQQARNAEVGLFIGEKELWGKGIGTKALSLILDYGFFTLNFHRIYLRVYALNERASIVMRRWASNTKGKCAKLLIWMANTLTFCGWESSRMNGEKGFINDYWFFAA
jgi:RimJ/RimL family protein N-acetyltransferase